MVLKFGSKVKVRDKLFFVTDVGKRTIRARQIFPDNPQIHPFGRVTNAITSIPIRMAKQVPRTTLPKGMRRR